MKSAKGRSRGYSANAPTGGRNKQKSSGNFKRKRSDESSSDYVKSGNTYSRNKDAGKRSFSSRVSKSDKPFKSFRKRDDESNYEKSDLRKRSYSSRDNKGDKPFRSFRKRDDESNYEKSDSRKRSYSSRDNKGDKPFKSFRKRDDEGGFERKSTNKRVFNKDGDRSLSRRKSNSSKRYNTFSNQENSYAESDTSRKNSFRSAGKNRLLKGKKKKDFSSETHSNSRESSIRLNRYIANSGICSRREADEMIEAGLISVNGEIVTQLGTKVSQDDVVKYNGETIRNEKPQYLLLNKPKDYITTMDDLQDRRTVMSLIAGACKERIYPVGRLDRNTTGVLLFTNDGDLAKKLTHPSYEVQKIYHVELDKNLRAEDMEVIRQGVKLEDGMAMVDDIQYDAGFQDKSQVGVEIHSGRNRIVRRIFESLGYNVIKLDRVMFAGLTKKDVTRGRWRMLSEMEVNNLKMITARVNKKKEKRPRLRK